MKIELFALAAITIIVLVILNYSHGTLYHILINQSKNCDEICRVQNYRPIPNDIGERKRLLDEAKATFDPILEEYRNKIQDRWVTHTSYGIGINMRNDGVFETEFEYSNMFYMVLEELEIVSPERDHPDAGKIIIAERRVFPTFLSFGIIIVGVSCGIGYRIIRR